MPHRYTPGSAATLIWTREGAPCLVKGTLGEARSEDVVITLDPAIPAARIPVQGERLVLCLESPERIKVTARVGAVSGHEVRLRTSGYEHLSRREYPRIDTLLGLVFRLIDDGGNDLKKHQRDMMSAWARPVTPNINFAVSGLAFIAQLPYPKGAVLGMRFTFPQDDGAEAAEAVTMEAKGEVVRSAPADPAEDDPSAGGHHIAVKFIDLSEEVRDALTDFTLHEQDAFLGMRAEGSGSEGEDV